MKTNLAYKRLKYLRNNFISYEELMKLSDEVCVKVSRTYFDELIALGTLLNIKEKEYWEIINKYLKIERMRRYILGNKHIETPYDLISVKDIKSLVNLMRGKAYTKPIILKSDINVSRLNEIHNNIKKQFILKQNGSNKNQYVKK